ncbi:uncharacterized protein F5Z01DRAFT_111728 [Emericellopsis atlantica]|uniref:Metallo-beta-lactamase domain-containing protein n=1 Tax=Emericellopsis atlantica TaxID=2614577 RepID=A0A9P7ZL54_9HYPO|nr:uncharacterized protein F5Z01DRAFT_111728 [Emericellopsis atlantica]KAG9254020.1 hypothetical protein F5Z01DRAFT_111728 [Emericellopsis atlantica]
MASTTSTKEYVLPKLPASMSDATVDVSIIDTTSNIICPSAAFMEPIDFGLETMVVPAFSFMVRNTKSHRAVLFDLGVRKDWQNLPAPMLARLKNFGFVIETEKGVRDILEEHGQDTSATEAIIWSHGHFDHTGDPSTFEGRTELVIGPGSKAGFTPGYPTDDKSGVLESDFAGRNVREITSDEFDLTIGRMPAMDYFGDQSFYLLDVPGHCQGHMCALARVTSQPDSFILLGADCVHHMGQLRPNKWTPLEDDISPNPLQDSGMCPADAVNALCREKDRGSPFFEPTSKGAHADAAIAKETIDKVQELDALDNVWLAVAHDPAILEVADLYPQKANDFMHKGWKQRTRWSFLKDLVPGIEAVRGQNLHKV